MEKYSRVIYSVLFAVFLIAINVGITKYMLSNQLSVIVEQLDVPRVKTIDMDLVVTALIDDGFTTEEVLAYVDNLNKVMHHQNILVLDNKAIVNNPKDYQLNSPDRIELHDYLKHHGIEVSTPKSFKDHVKKSNEQLNEFLKQQ